MGVFCTCVGFFFMKICTKCKVLKELTDFNKRTSSPDGHRSQCRNCELAYKKIYDQTNTEKVKAYRKKHYWGNIDKTKAQVAVYYQNNKEKALAKDKEYALANP